MNKKSTKKIGKRSKIIKNNLDNENIKKLKEKLENLLKKEKVNEEHLENSDNVGFEEMRTPILPDLEESFDILKEPMKGLDTVLPRGEYNERKKDISNHSYFGENYGLKNYGVYELEDLNTGQLIMDVNQVVHFVERDRSNGFRPENFASMEQRSRARSKARKLFSVVSEEDLIRYETRILRKGL